MHHHALIETGKIALPEYQITEKLSKYQSRKTRNHSALGHAKSD
jgi:hypothetical protein